MIRRRQYERQSYAIAPEQIDYIIRQAFKRKISLSELVREMIDAYRARNPIGRKK